MQFLYSLGVIVPITLTSPPERISPIIPDKSVSLSLLPLFKTFCISSMKRIYFLDDLSSSKRPLTRSSSIPRKLVPDTILMISIITISLPSRIGGTLPFTIIVARPLIIAVFPTPPFPTRITLFFFLLAKTLMIS